MSEQIEAPEVFNAKFVESLLAHPDGHIKNASDASSTLIRRKIRENGFSRRILPPKTVSKADLNYMPDTELPVIVEEMEPNSPGAKSIPFNDTPDSVGYRGDKFVIKFCLITTREYVKNIYELMTYKNDLRQIIIDNALKDVQKEEDARFIAEVDEMVGSVGGNGDSGHPQNFEINGQMTRDSYTEVYNYLEDYDLNNGVILMNRRTGKNFLKFDRSEIGGDLAQNLFTDGLQALTEAKIGGIPHIFTIKRDLVPNNVGYVFAEPKYFGRFYILTDVTMHVKREKNIIRTSAEECIGVSFANVAAAARFEFVPA